MNTTVNNLGTIADIISLTSKALDIASRAISLLEAASTEAEQVAQKETAEVPAKEESKEPTPAPATQQPNYCAEAIRFNEEFLNTHYDLRFNTLKRATEFRRCGNVRLQDAARAGQDKASAHRAPGTGAPSPQRPVHPGEPPLLVHTTAGMPACPGRNPPLTTKKE